MTTILPLIPTKDVSMAFQGKYPIAMVIVSINVISNVYYKITYMLQFLETDIVIVVTLPLPPNKRIYNVTKLVYLTKMQVMYLPVEILLKVIIVFIKITVIIPTVVHTLP